MADFSTPERALASLEDAYVRKDIDGAIAAKDFNFEAREMLLILSDVAEQMDDAMVEQTAQVLELAFRSQIEEEGFPDFQNVRCRVTDKKDLREDLVELVEECVLPDGSGSKQVLHAVRNQTGWHIVVLPSNSSDR